MNARDPEVTRKRTDWERVPLAVLERSDVQTRRFTADEVWRMAEVGTLRPDERVEPTVPSPRSRSYQ